MPQARYKQVVDRLAAEMRAGQLAPGMRLPTHRELAASEGLALVTATRVYAELEAMGLVSGEVGRGTFVREAALPRGLGVDQQACATGVLDLNFKGFNEPLWKVLAPNRMALARTLAGGGPVTGVLRREE